jgi:hypothetical protein
MFAGVDKVVVEKDLPDRMHELSSAVGEEFGGGCFSKYCAAPIIELVGQLK